MTTVEFIKELKVRNKDAFEDIENDALNNFEKIYLKRRSLSYEEFMLEDVRFEQILSRKSELVLALYFAKRFSFYKDTYCREKDFDFSDCVLYFFYYETFRHEKWLESLSDEDRDNYKFYGEYYFAELKGSVY